MILLILSALISGSEVAFFSLNPNDLEELKSKKSKSIEALNKLLNSPKRLLATILIANNFVNIAIVIISAFLVSRTINFEVLGETLTFLIQVVLTTFVLLLFGEVIPKIYATKHALSMSVKMALPFLFLKSVLKPLSAILLQTTKFVDKRIKKKGHEVSVNELSQALDLTDFDQTKDEHRILKSIVTFGNISVSQIMKARVDVFAVEVNTPYDELVEKIKKEGFSRIPVYEENFDKIVGILYIKDLLPYLEESKTFEWQKLIRPPFFIPENKKLDDMLAEFQQKKMHIAIVVDEYGGTSGIITLEDVLEEIVGEISDEFDDEDIVYSKLDDNNYVFEAKVSLHDFCRIVDIDMEEYLGDLSKEVDTLGGLIIELAGKIPKKNEKIKYNCFQFTIEASDKRKVKRIKVNINREDIVHEVNS
ncbi:MAG: gliding motility-associated protein GldE [Vicingaceae bacterium]